MRRDPDVVKTPPTAGESDAPARDPARSFRRHLQGYELGLLTLGMVFSCALLALPRASVPGTLPLPRIDHAEARRSAARDRELSALAESEGLPFEVRALGESIRHFGQSVTHGLDTLHDREDLRERFRAAVEKGQAPLLLRLRAVQTQFFLRALADFERGGKPSADLQELGADFVARAKENGWFASDVDLLTDDGTQIAPLNYPHLGHTEIFNSVEDFYKKFYFRPSKIAEIVKEMLTSRDMLVRRLREGVEFFQFLKNREDMIVS